MSRNGQKNGSGRTKRFREGREGLVEIAQLVGHPPDIEPVGQPVSAPLSQAPAQGGLGEQLAAEIAIVAATICYAGAAIFGRGFKGLDPIAPAAGSLLCGAAMLVPASLVVDRPWTLEPSTSSMLALVGLAVFSTALAFVIYFRLIQTLGSVGTTSQAYLRVPIGVAIGVLFLGESLSPAAWIGVGCVVIGVAAMTIPARQIAGAPKAV